MAFTLLVGGARSGKSLLSEQLASAVSSDSGARVAAIVTAEAIDEEMQDRITRHQQDRPSGWITIEAPYDLVEALNARPSEEVVVVDCVTVWLTNLLVRGESAAVIELEGQRLADALAARAAPAFVVSNELGLGLVPGDPMSREFRDIQGRVNQSLSRSAKLAYFVIAGRVLELRDSEAALAQVRSC